MIKMNILISNFIGLFQPNDNTLVMTQNISLSQLIDKYAEAKTTHLPNFKWQLCSLWMTCSLNQVLLQHHIFPIPIGTLSGISTLSSLIIINA